MGENHRTTKSLWEYIHKTLSDGPLQFEHKCNEIHSSTAYSIRFQIAAVTRSDEDPSIIVEIPRPLTMSVIAETTLVAVAKGNFIEREFPYQRHKTDCLADITHIAEKKKKMVGRRLTKTKFSMQRASLFHVFNHKLPPPTPQARASSHFSAQ